MTATPEVISRYQSEELPVDAELEVEINQTSYEGKKSISIKAK